MDLIFNNGTFKKLMDIRISKGAGSNADSISIGPG